MHHGLCACVSFVALATSRLILQLCAHKTCRLCLHGRNGFLLHRRGSCSITQLLSRSNIWKRHCVISQEPFLYSVRTLSSPAFVAHKNLQMPLFFRKSEVHRRKNFRTSFMRGSHSQTHKGVALKHVLEKHRICFLCPVSSMSCTGQSVCVTGHQGNTTHFCTSNHHHCVF